MCIACNPIGLFSRKTKPASRHDFLKKAGVLALGVGAESLGSPSFAAITVPAAPAKKSTEDSTEGLTDPL